MLTFWFCVKFVFFLSILLPNYSTYKVVYRTQKEMHDDLLHDVDDESRETIMNMLYMFVIFLRGLVFYKLLPMVKVLICYFSFT